VPPPPSNQPQGRSTSELSNLQHQPATHSARLLQQHQHLAAQLQLLVLPPPPLEPHQLLLLQPLDLCNLLLLNSRDLLSASVQEARIVPQARGALQLLEELGNSFDVLFPPLFLVKH